MTLLLYKNKIRDSKLAWSIFLLSDDLRLQVNIQGETVAVNPLYYTEIIEYYINFTDTLFNFVLNYLTSSHFYEPNYRIMVNFLSVRSIPEITAHLVDKITGKF